MRSHDELALGLVAAGIGQQRAEVGIDVEQSDHVRRPCQGDCASSHDDGLPGSVGFQTSVVERVPA